MTYVMINWHRWSGRGEDKALYFTSFRSLIHSLLNFIIRRYNMNFQAIERDCLVKDCDSV